MIIFPNGRRTIFSRHKAVHKPEHQFLGGFISKDRLFLVSGLVVEGVLRGQHLKDFKKPFLRIRAHFNVDVAQGGRRAPSPDGAPSLGP